MMILPFALCLFAVATSQNIHFKSRGSENGVTCSDGEYECPSNTTCCRMQNDHWGCCNITNAVCCSDRLHCCPASTTCDLTSGTCKPQKTNTLMLETTSGHTLQTSSAVGADITCPDNKTHCYDNETCCLRTDKTSFGCCASVHAVCCPDHIHCCAPGTRCDMVRMVCVGLDSATLHPLTPSTAKPQASKVKSGSRHWKYRLSGKKRSKARFAINDFMDMRKRWKSSRSPAQALAVLCRDNVHQCPDNWTCCKTQSSQYGCCDIAKAVCCSDGKHCCPHGYSCDMQKQACCNVTQVDNIPFHPIRRYTTPISPPGGHP